MAFERACCLEDLGRSEEAAEAYHALLAREPLHFGALTNLGLMLLDRDAPRVARPYLTAAAAVRPDDPAAHVNVAQLERDAGESDAALCAYERALQLDPEHSEAHQGIGILYEMLGDDKSAAHQFACAFSKPMCRVLPYNGDAAPVRVLLLVSARGGDLVTNRFLDDRVFQTYLFPVEGFRDGLPLPAHHVVLNAIGDADRAGDALARAMWIPGASRAPVVNHPARVRMSGRLQNATRFVSLPGVVVPRVERLDRAKIHAKELERRGWHFPFLLRAPGFHAGRMFERVENEPDLDLVLERLRQRELFAISFVDVRSPDGYVRKYRIVFVGGKMYPVHVAVSKDWKVHAFSADVQDEQQCREERNFLADPNAVFGPGVVATLQAVGEVLGLDYAGVDFSLDVNGKVVIFEANATMAVHLPPGDKWDGRRAAASRVIEAMQALLIERARSAAALK